jgi:hypothetical protein
MKLNINVAEIEAKRKKELEEEREESSELYEDIKATIINLVLNKFPDLSIYERDLVYDQFFEFEGERASTARPPLLQAKEYQDELWNLPTADLFALERELIGAEEAKYKLSAHGSINRGWFFDQPDAQADFEYWSKAEYWTSDEAVAISFGKNPKVVTGEALKNYLGKAQFADNYFLRCDLLDRAIQSDRLPKEIPPADFLEWAHQRSIPIPSALTNCLAGLGTISSHAWDGFDPDSSTYPAELDIAFQAWRATSTRPDSSKTPKEQIYAWVRKHYPETSKEAQQRIAIMCNWAPRGGRPSR